MTATFIISFDCEGKWGIADCLEDSHTKLFTTKNFIFVYQKLLNLLDKYEMPASFAFVGAFTLSIEEFYTYRDKFRAPNIGGKNWLVNFDRQIKTKQFDGWFCPEAFALVKQKKIHEIASHGFLHLPLTKKLITKEDFIYEMELIKKISPYKHDRDMTFVYPRNQIGFVRELENYGFIGYRTALKSYPLSILNSGIRFANEFNIFFSKADHFSISNFEPLAIPCGRFLNWRYGARKYVPLKITEWRWKNMIKDAVKNNKVLHVWSHPHNFITGKNMFELFERILHLVSIERNKGHIKVMTQRDYVKSFRKMDES